MKHIAHYFCEVRRKVKQMRNCRLRKIFLSGAVRHLQQFLKASWFFLTVWLVPVWKLLQVSSFPDIID